MSQINLFLFLSLIILVSGCVQQDPKFCRVDSDCVPGNSCCHPQECVSKEFNDRFMQDNCKEITGCTAVCVFCPDCKCVNNTCTKVGVRDVNEVGCC